MFAKNVNVHEDSWRHKLNQRNIPGPELNSGLLTYINVWRGITIYESRHNGRIMAWETTLDCSVSAVSTGENRQCDMIKITLIRDVVYLIENFLL